MVLICNRRNSFGHESVHATLSSFSTIANGKNLQHFKKDNTWDRGEQKGGKTWKRKI